jgi:hypothetical protein
LYAARGMQPRRSRFAFVLGLSLFGIFYLPVAARAESSLGPHVGINLDWDAALLGLEARVDMVGAGPATLQLNPTFSYYFDDDDDDDAVFNFSLNFPFEFKVRDSVLRPFIAPGLGLMIFTRDNFDDDTDLKLNLIGGLLFDLSPVELFVQLKVAIGDSTEAEIVGGLLFQL